MTKHYVPTDLDEALRLEAVYYSAQVPRDLATLTVLGAVFDKVYFPGVHIPTSSFDQAELDKEIERIDEVTRGNPVYRPLAACRSDIGDEFAMANEDRV